KSLISQLDLGKAQLNEIKSLSIEQIYKNRPVLEIEAAGFEVLGGLLDAFLGAVFHTNSRHHRKLFDLIPGQFLENDRKTGSDDYEKILKITDFVSSLTDQAALSLYRKIKGIELPRGY
ncbi:MAG: deoxyguanosinetriphosphate triphosphohydrolase, partial [Hymenobacteraceae bacterium]|nr:deoxyguanosinetriphosphate triphosphohydrolase [Hymenobacteraceae bacterium]